MDQYAFARLFGKIVLNKIENFLCVIEEVLALLILNWYKI